MHHHCIAGWEFKLQPCGFRPARIRDRQANNPDQAVVIAADRAVRYEEVVRVLDLLQQKGVRKVGLLLRPQTG